MTRTNLQTIHHEGEMCHFGVYQWLFLIVTRKGDLSYKTAHQTPLYISRICCSDRSLVF